ncbi:MAG TPA: TetR/AcrR family transcriptional regulator [Longimicrobiaceae bacterium]|nr:TetR/AcrR family transcriptional regulator [Longimicrobiaceae bacterium]
MGINERREREKEALRTRIVEAARDIVSAEGLEALSMRALAERIEYSPATLYLYFKDKDELIQEVVREGFRRMGECMCAESSELGSGADATQQHRASGRGYARFALENTAYFRVMFELPTVAQMDCPTHDEEEAQTGQESWTPVVEVVQRAMDAGLYALPDAHRGAVISWGLVHGLVSLYLSGHLAEVVMSNEEFMKLLEDAMDSLRVGWTPRETRQADLA